MCHEPPNRDSKYQKNLKFFFCFWIEYISILYFYRQLIWRFNIVSNISSLNNFSLLPEYSLQQYFFKYEYNFAKHAKHFKRFNLILFVLHNSIFSLLGEISLTANKCLTMFVQWSSKISFASNKTFSFLRWIIFNRF